jgi:hypothetical protein
METRRPKKKIKPIRRFTADLPFARKTGQTAGELRAGGPAETKRFTAKKRTTRKPPSQRYR